MPLLNNSPKAFPWLQIAVSVWLCMGALLVVAVLLAIGMDATIKKSLQQAREREKLAARSLSAYAPDSLRNLHRSMTVRIRRNWFPPHSDRTRRVVLRFNVHRGGSISRLVVQQSSGWAAMDKTALEAVRQSVPFRGYPASLKKNTVPVEFTLDCKVYKPKKSAAVIDRPRASIRL
jgi:TonB family protein